MLSPLQQAIALIIAGLPEATDFALAGGAALIARGDVDRRTRDLDFFGLAPSDVDRLLPVVDRTLQAAGYSVVRIREAPAFARLEVEGLGDRTEVDLAADARLFPAEAGPYGPVLAGKELAADNMLALFGRAEARDFVDVEALESRYGLEGLCRLAVEKDPGFGPPCCETCWSALYAFPETSSTSAMLATSVSRHRYAAGETGSSTSPSDRRTASEQPVSHPGLTRSAPGVLVIPRRHTGPMDQLALIEQAERDWRLDERTRELGRRGIKMAREALRLAAQRSAA